MKNGHHHRHHHRHRPWRGWSTGFWVCLAAVAAGGCGDSSALVDGDGGALAEHPADSDAAAPDQSGTPDGDADGESDASPPTCVRPDGGSGPTCNALIATGPCVAQIQVDDNAPAPHGGQLAAGMYELIDRTLYTDPGGATGPIGEPLVESLALQGSGASWTLDQAMFTSAMETRTTASASVSGTMIRLVPTCPSGDNLQADAGADAEQADGGSDGGPPGAPGEVVYYTSSDSGSTLVLYRLGPTGPVRADTYVRR
ncbi:MAG TPA: hypothetical protein VFH68_10170 [Polyangia bacterium]|jgi:hypothetical protein|nr:hypothetical protein [Polyangia bacterium]